MAGPVKLAVLNIIVAMELTVMRLGLLGFLHIPLLPKQMIQCENSVMIMHFFFVSCFSWYPVSHFPAFVYVWNFVAVKCTCLEVCVEGLKAAYGPWRLEFGSKILAG